MRLDEVMTKGARTVSPAVPAEDAWELMRRGGVRHLVVTDGSNVVGVVSDRDASGRAGAAVRAGRTVADLMTRHAVTMSPTHTVRQAANLMRGRTIGCVPIVDRGRLVGVVTVSDLLEVLGRGIDRPAQPARPSATHRAPHRKQTRASRAW